MPNVTGYKWGGSSLGSPGGVVTWSLAGAGLDIDAFDDNNGRSVDGDSFLNFDYRTEISEALNAWSEAGDIEFMQVEDGGGSAGSNPVADIRIFFGEIPGSVIGMAYYPVGPDIAGDILLDTDRVFNSDQDIFAAVALHEVGHALGLGHVSYNSVMTPRISASTLQTDDINGIRQIYGAQDNAPTLYRMTSRQTDLNILESSFQLTVIGTVAGNRIDGTQADETILGAGGNDVLLGRQGNDHLEGGTGNDKIYSGRGNDVVIAGDGNDYVLVGGGIESFDGGNGKDYISYYNSSNGVRLDLQADTVSGSWAINDTIMNFESAAGSKTGDDVLRGTVGANTLRGYGGNDVLHGLEGNDRLVGGRGNDKIYSGKGDDVVFGGDGNDYIRVGGGKESFDGGDGKDYISYFDSSNGVRIDLRADKVSGSWAVNDAIKNFESAAGSDTGDDVLLGTAGANTLRGHGGDDTFFARDGADRLYGGDGKDHLDGGNGNDLLWGGKGADVFHIDFGEDHDVIKDFQNNIDEIQLDNFVFSGGQDAFDFARQVNSDVVFDFGGGEGLTIEDTTIGKLYNDLVLV